MIKACFNFRPILLGDVFWALKIVMMRITLKEPPLVSSSIDALCVSI